MSDSSDCSTSVSANLIAFAGPFLSVDHKVDHPGQEGFG